MAGKSDYMENKVLDIIGGTAFSAPTDIYVALYTAAPTDAGGGTEVSGGSYARKQVTNNSTNWPAASGGAKSNGTDIVFATPTANWGTIVAFALFDAVAGNMLYWGLVTPNKTVNNGDPAPKFAAGDLDLTED